MTRRVCMLLLLSIAAVGDGPKPRPRPIYVIPFEFAENSIWLDVKVNEKGPMSFILDTGAGNCAVDWDEASRAGLDVVEAIQSGPVGAGDGTARVGVVRNATVEFGPVRLDLPYIGAVSLAVVRQSWNRPLMGVIGTPFFEKYVVAIDYTAREMRLYDPEKFEYTGEGYSWPVRLSGKLPMAKAVFALPGAGRAEGEFLVDSGLRGVILFNAPFATGRGMETAVRSSGGRLVSSPTMGAQGESGRLLARIQSFGAGPYTIANPVAGLSQAKGGFYARADVGGAIGTEFLKRFTVVVDYKRSRMILEPNAGLGEPERYDASGLVLRKVGTPPRITVWRVVPDSPASEAGMAEGDIVAAVAGKPNVDLAAVRDALLNEGETVRLSVEHTGKVREVSLKLRRVL